MGCNGSVWKPCRPVFVVLLTLPVGDHVLLSADHVTRLQFSYHVILSLDYQTIPVFLALQAKHLMQYSVELRSQSTIGSHCFSVL